MLRIVAGLLLMSFAIAEVSQPPIPSIIGQGDLRGPVYLYHLMAHSLH